MAKTVAEVKEEVFAEVFQVIKGAIDRTIVSFHAKYPTGSESMDAYDIKKLIQCFRLEISESIKPKDDKSNPVLSTPSG